MTKNCKNMSSPLKNNKYCVLVNVLQISRLEIEWSFSTPCPLLFLEVIRMAGGQRRLKGRDLPPQRILGLQDWRFRPRRHFSKMFAVRTLKTFSLTRLRVFSILQRFHKNPTFQLLLEPNQSCETNAAIVVNGISHMGFVSIWN